MTFFFNYIWAIIIQEGAWRKVIRVWGSGVDFPKHSASLQLTPSNFCVVSVIILLIQKVIVIILIAKATPEEQLANRCVFVKNREAWIPHLSCNQTKTSHWNTLPETCLGWVTAMTPTTSHRSWTTAHTLTCLWYKKNWMCSTFHSITLNSCCAISVWTRQGDQQRHPLKYAAGMARNILWLCQFLSSSCHRPQFDLPSEILC